jgi:aspartyl-tRNA(Asn)/glutamyl-tRNA(Gln) amidotransferase subunit A
MKSIILQMHEQLINGEKTPIDFVNDSIEKINAIKHTNSVVLDTFSFAKTNAELLNKEINNNKDNLLFGIPYAMKDSICTKGIVTTGGSMFLKDFIPPYSATIFSLLNDSKTIMMCKSNLDEFGMGGTGLYSAFGHVKNFHNLKSIVGGSSSGSTNLVAASAVPFAIGTDTGDSARRPPSFAGVVGFKPTYGLISRYGVLPYAPSLDHVGIITRTVADAAIVSEHLIKYDEKDFTSQKIADTQFFKNIKIKNKLTVGVVKHIENYLSADVLKVYLEAIDLIKANGHTIKYVSFDEKLLQAVHAIYYAITYSEANSC